MIPIQKLLSRIRYDRDFAVGEFVLGYQDRFSPELHHVSLREVVESASGAIELWNDEGRLVAIPLHRIVEVRRNGEIIWERARPPASPSGP